MKTDPVKGKKQKKGVFARLLAWISKGSEQARKKGQAPCRS